MKSTLSNLVYIKLTLMFLLLIACSKKEHQARFVILPDTQTYAEKYPEVLDAQIDWILKNSDSIDVVIQQGDLTQNNNDKEWEIVRNAFTKLNHAVPYILAVGNHDMGSAPGKFADTRNTTLFNSYFPYSEMMKLPGFGGVYEKGKMENAYYTLTAGGEKWLILTLEFGPRDNVLEWAGKIIQQHPNSTAVLNTHSYMYSDSTRQGVGDNWRPQAYGIGKDAPEGAVNDGEEIWNKLVRLYPNIRFVFSGHVLNSGVGNLVSINDEGFPVYQFLANYQEGVKGSVKGGNGYLKILDFDFKKNTLSVKTFSPYIDDFLQREGHNFKVRQVNLYE